MLFNILCSYKMDVIDNLEEELRESDGEAETGNASPPAKRWKVKQKVLQWYRAEYAVKYPVIRRSSLSETHAYCTLCTIDLSIGHGGLQDVKKHVATAKQQAKQHTSISTRKVTDMFVVDEDVSIIRAGTLFTDFVIEHNLPLACTDHAGSLFRKMFT